MAELSKLLNEVAREITPSQQEARQEREFAEQLIKKLEKKIGREAGVKFVGSAARDTGLRGDRDIDLFIAFPKTKSREYIVRKTIQATKQAIKAKWIMHYAEHPYLKTELGKYCVEVIPCFQISPHEEIVSAVDRSPLHMDYLQNKLSEEQKRGVRVLKQFLKNAGIYGAELEVQGFSGLVCEYLILNYLSFLNLVREASDWRSPVVIDVEVHYQNTAKKDVAKRFNSSALVLVDVIDRNRNTAAALSEENLARFISLCRAFIKKPSKEFFFKREGKYSNKQSALNSIKKREHAFYLISLSKPAVVEDILFPQLRRTAASTAKHLEMQGFQVFDSTSFATQKNCFILIELVSSQLPRVKRVQGPIVSERKSCEAFLKVHKKTLRGPYIKGSRVFVEEERNQRNAIDFLNKMKKNPMKYGVASHFLSPLKKSRIFEGSSIAGVDNEALQQVASYLFKKEFFW